MHRKDFEQLVREAVGALPEAGKRAMENVGFVIEENVRPRKAGEVGIRHGEMLLGLYEGIPKTKRGAGYFGVLPDKITIFQKPIEELAVAEGMPVREVVFDVVWHEVGHHLGFDEPAIRDREKKREKERRAP